MSRIKYILFITVFLPIAVLCQTPANDPIWTQTWVDNFATTSFNSKWEQSSDWRNMCCRLDQSGAIVDYDLKAFRTEDNSNIQFFNTSSPNFIRLIVKNEVRIENVPSGLSPCPSNCNTWQFNYTAPKWLKSLNEFRYGYFEIRCRLPVLAGKNNFGIGANFWLYDHVTPTCSLCYSEIDVVEFRCLNTVSGLKENNIATSNSHFTPCCVPNASEYHDNPLLTNESINFSGNQFRKFGVSWTPDKIEFYRDGRLVYVSYNHPSDMIPMPMIIDFNVFKDSESIDANTILPYNYDIDYVKVYKLQNSQCNVDYINNVCNLNNYIPSIYQNITLGGCTLNLSGSINYTFRASNMITLNDGFNFSSSGDLILDNTSCHDQEIY